MRDEFVILVADRNRHVREFIGRELAADGYVVLGARDGRELVAIVEEGPRPDLLIVDLELPYLDGVETLGRLREFKDRLPVIIHTFLTEYATHPALGWVDGFVEKKGDNIHHLREMVASVLKRRYPLRYRAVLAGGPSDECR